MAAVLFARLAVLKNQIGGLSETEWKQNFTAACEAEDAKRLADWDLDWLALCDGKRFFRDLYQAYGVKVSPIKFKKMIVERMQREQTDSWVLVEKLLLDGLKVN